jgi:hypothetical protein
MIEFFSLCHRGTAKSRTHQRKILITISKRKQNLGELCIQTQKLIFSLIINTNKELKIKLIYLTIELTC